MTPTTDNNFDHDKLVELANIYSIDFSSQERYLLTDQLNIYIDVMKRSTGFLACDSLSSLALKLVQSRQHLVFPLVYRLIRLALTLPVATASVERVFSAMNIIKTDLRNKMGDDWLNDLMVCFVEREIFAKISDKEIMVHFHALKNRRGHLPPEPGVHYAICLKGLIWKLELWDHIVA
ncbi:hypothetical protein VPH35_067287 [Triticum aestivum]|uniref:uncharacterized protein isoform X2 n=1 Tax=Triticum aestivum TaxID=4565 RepID=UPI001D01C13A|nr:uncharacterized protein LOC123087056 isoform X2 [Triticum aestivum]